VSGQVEATDVRVAAQVAGRLLDPPVAEGDHVQSGQLIARLDTADAALALSRATAEREQAAAQLRLLAAGARPEDVRQAEAQLATAESDARAADSELASAQADVARFEALLASNSGSRKQRDDAVTRRDVAAARVRAARDRVRAARENVAKLRAGSRREDATITAPVAGVVTAPPADAAELLHAGAPIVVVTDLQHAWANVYVDEPDVPRLRIGQHATVFTDAGGPGLAGIVTYISPRAEFTPRNVQTAEDRSKLVYRIKVTVDNTAGVLKPGMPVEAELPFEAARP
jgi:HlyD family secretion protein